MQAYEGYLEDGRFFTFDGTQPNLKGRRRVTVTVFDEDTAEAKRQAEAKLFAELEEGRKSGEEKGWLTEEEADALIDSL